MPDTAVVMKRLIVVLCLLLVSCVTDPEGLTVKQYHLRENMFDQNNDLMARGEVQRLLHGAVSVEERRQKLGQYYHVIWNPANAGQMPVEIVFEYLQAGSGSTIKKMVHRADGTQRVVADFAIAGNDYRQKGRVLAWRATVREGGKVIASKQSYMWR